MNTAGAPAWPRGRRRGGCMVRLLLLLVVLTAIAALAWMLLLPVAVESQIRSRTGFDVSVASLSCNAFTGRLAIRGLVLSNPPSFPVRDFLELRDFSMEVEVSTLFGDRLVLDALTVDVRKVTLVRRADGQSNAEVFQEKFFGPAPPASSAAAATSPAPIAGRKFLIRRFALRFDRLVLADHTSLKPVVEEFALGLDQHYENITDTKQLIVPEVLSRLAAANLGPALGRFVPGDFGQALGAAAREASLRGGELIQGAGQAATDLFKGMREKLEESKKP